MSLQFWMELNMYIESFNGRLRDECVCVEPGEERELQIIEIFVHGGLRQ